jgi:predicted nucleotidyltransferase
MPLRFFDLVRVLREHGAEFVVIGGFALAFHGAERATKDVDIVPKPTRENLARLWAALEELEARPAELGEFRPEELPFTLQGLIEGEGNWVLHTKLGRLDVMQWVKGIESYDDLREHAEGVDIPELGGELLVAGFDDLITMKREAGRDQDRMDIVRLRIARGLEA